MRKKYLYTIAITMSIMLAGCGTSTSSDNAENSDNKAVSEIENFESKDSSDNSSDESEKQDDQRSWAKGQIKTLEEGAFKYSAILTEDDTAWIYRIDLEADEETETLEIPDSIEGKQVTCLGRYIKPGETAEGELADKAEECDGFNIFGSAVYYNKAGSIGEINEISPEANIKNIIIPESVTTIEECTFALMSSVTTISIPESIKKVPAAMFYGCESLKEVVLPSNLEKLDVTAFAMCTNLDNVELPEECKKYKAMDKCIIKSDDNSLVYCYAAGKRYNIPDGVKILNGYSLANCRAKEVTIPASVETIKKGAFELNTENASYNIENVTVEKNNKQYAKDGQTIYNKKDGSLSVVIVEKTGDKSKYVMSDKVKKLTPEHSVVNHNTEMEAIDEIYLSKNLECIESGDSMRFVNQNNVVNLYYSSKKCPKINKNAEPAFESCIHVPKGTKNGYENMYKGYGYIFDGTIHKIEEWE